LSRVPDNGSANDNWLEMNRVIFVALLAFVALAPSLAAAKKVRNGFVFV
jgi:hypothetical protein